MQFALIDGRKMGASEGSTVQLGTQEGSRTNFRNIGSEPSRLLARVRRAYRDDRSC
jgi:hypothetical protein